MQSTIRHKQKRNPDSSSKEERIQEFFNANDDFSDESVAYTISDKLKIFLFISIIQMIIKCIKMPAKLFICYVQLKNCLYFCLLHTKYLLFYTISRRLVKFWNDPPYILHHLPSCFKFRAKHSTFIWTGLPGTRPSQNQRR